MNGNLLFKYITREKDRILFLKFVFLFSNPHFKAFGLIRLYQKGERESKQKKLGLTKDLYSEARVRWVF